MSPGLDRLSRTGPGQEGFKFWCGANLNCFWSKSWCSSPDRGCSLKIHLPTNHGPFQMARTAIPMHPRTLINSTYLKRKPLLPTESRVWARPPLNVTKCFEFLSRLFDLKKSKIIPYFFEGNSKIIPPTQTLCPSYLGLGGGLHATIFEVQRAACIH
jgi:hypothetical protein